MDKVLILLVTAILFTAMLAAVAGGMMRYNGAVHTVIDWELQQQQSQTQ